MYICISVYIYMYIYIYICINLFSDSLFSPQFWIFLQWIVVLREQRHHVQEVSVEGEQLLKMAMEIMDFLTEKYDFAQLNAKVYQRAIWIFIFYCNILIQL